MCDLKTNKSLMYVARQPQSKGVLMTSRDAASPPLGLFFLHPCREAYFAGKRPMRSASNRSCPDRHLNVGPRDYKANALASGLSGLTVLMVYISLYSKAPQILRTVTI